MGRKMRQRRICEVLYPTESIMKLFKKHTLISYGKILSLNVIKMKLILVSKYTNNVVTFLTGKDHHKEHHQEM
jgi:hypothetical protein